MKIIGLTGGIGSGKSTVASILKEMGAVVIDLDEVGHEILSPGTPAWQQVVKTFGRGILSPQEDIDRQKLAQIVFNSPEALRKLNRITHPRIDREVQSRLRKLQEQQVEVVILEAPLIDAVSWVPQAEKIWVIRASEEARLKRLKRRGMGESESLKRMASQQSAEKYIQKGLVVINNDGTVEDLRAEVIKHWEDLHNK